LYQKTKPKQQEFLLAERNSTTLLPGSTPLPPCSPPDALLSQLPALPLHRKYFGRLPDHHHYHQNSPVLESDDGETVEATRLLAKRDNFEFELNLTHKRNKYMYCGFILPPFLYLHKNYINYISVEKTHD
jgi:hypothetical protein